MIDNFIIQELVPEHVFNKRGEKAWQLFDWRALKTLEWLREELGPCIVNNWHIGGAYSQSGLRTHEMYMQDTKTPAYIAHIDISESYSQHKYGRAFDCKFQRVSAEEAREYIKKYWPACGLGWPITIEEDVSWLHFDCRSQAENLVYSFQP